MSARSLLVRLVLGATILVVVPSISLAQSGAPTLRQPSPERHGTRSFGPRRDAAISGVRLQVAEAPLTPVAVAAGSRGRGQAMAIVGGAAFLGGLMIGDDVGTVIAVGGLGVGIYGLWLWLSK